MVCSETLVIKFVLVDKTIFAAVEDNASQVFVCARMEHLDQLAVTLTVRIIVALVIVTHQRVDVYVLRASTELVVVSPVQEV